MAPDRARPLTEREFDALMDRLGPFEPAPALAVGVSGGADSLALCLLANSWVRRRDGTLTALTVDHRLRAGSAREARRVGRWLGTRGIAHRVLPWRGAKPTTGVEAAARGARHSLMADWCRRNGVLHLALAHHLEDQAETFLIRLGRGSGLDGLAGMAPVVERPSHRILRPLLTVRRGRLAALLRTEGQSWVDDPSNEDPAHTRNRVRAALPALASIGLDADALGAAAAKLGEDRAATERATARLLARAVEAFPAGYCRVDARALSAAPRPIALRALAGVLMAVGGAVYPPRTERLERILDQIAGVGLGGARTLGGCIVAPRGGRVVVAREPNAVQPPLMLRPGAAATWDRRFVVRHGRARHATAALEVGALGLAGWSALRRELDGPVAIPAPARPALPAIRSKGCLVAVPHLGWLAPSEPSNARISIDFLPPNALARLTFSVV